jgi:DNA-binding response OmpR family regulator
VTILVVVRDDDLRALVRHMLQAPDRCILVAAHAAEAADVAGASELDLLVTELESPIDGRVLAERFRARRPDLPVVYVGGHPDSAEPREETILRTPFTREELADAVRCVLRGA